MQTPHPRRPTARRRIALYSHDTQGLGHVRRNIAVAGALVASHPDTDVLLLTGAGEATRLPLPPRTEVVTLPALGKSRSGRYRAAVLDMPVSELVDLRSRLIATVVDAFAPDLLVVDKVARGVDGELDRTLLRLCARPDPSTKVVLGLRDVLDDPAVARRDWSAQRTTSAVVEHYDAVWVYGDPAVHDPVAAYGLPRGVSDKVSYTGYLGHGRADVVRSVAGVAPVRPTRPYVLCVVGGGQDGVAVARAFVAADLPAGHVGVVVTGPYMQLRLRDELREAAARRPDLLLLEFEPELVDLVAGAAAVVSMGGYNTVCEVLAAGRPALVVPRVVPRTEQAIRADRLAELGELDTLRPHRATPPRISAWLAAAVTRPAPTSGVDLDGLSRLPALADALLADGRAAPPDATRRSGRPVVRREVTDVPA